MRSNAAAKPEGIWQVSLSLGLVTNRWDLIWAGKIKKWGFSIIIRNACPSLATHLVAFVWRLAILENIGNSFLVFPLTWYEKKVQDSEIKVSLSRTRFLPNRTILEWEISSKSPNVLLEEVNQSWTLRHCHAKNPFVCWWYLISLSQPVQWFSADSGRSQKVGSWSDLGRFCEGKVDEPTPKMEVWREKLWCFSRWIPQSYYVNLMKSDEVYIVCSSSIWNNDPQVTFMFLTVD